MRATNDEWGIDSLVDRLRKENLELVVLEATGDLEHPAAAALAAAAFPVSIFNPRQVRDDFAKAAGRLPKIDRPDAAVLAHFAEAVRSRGWQTNSANNSGFCRLLGEMRSQWPLMPLPRTAFGEL